MEADIHTLYKSDFYRMLDFKCKCKDCRTSEPEYSNSFSISFIRKGNFTFNVFRNSLDSYTGCVLVTKPYYERTVTHNHAIPDECTILDFSNTFFDEIKESYHFLNFLNNNDVHAALLETDVETELLHDKALNYVLKGNAEKLNLDNIVIEIIENVFGKIDSNKQNTFLSAKLKKYHLSTIEDAKEYMLMNYQNDISLLELARHCHLSPFHFSRIFKKITSYSPYQFLIGLRLKNSELLVKQTQEPIFDIAIQSGFNSIEHFTSSFTKQYGLSPTTYRNLI